MHVTDFNSTSSSYFVSICKCAVYSEALYNAPFIVDVFFAVIELPAAITSARVTGLALVVAVL